MKLKGIAATTGIGSLYGLLFAVLFLAPLPQISSQSDAPVLDIPGGIPDL